MQYATLEQFQEHLQNQFSPEEENAANSKLKAASASIEDYLEVSPSGFFLPASVPSTKRVLGGGQSFITLPAPLSGNVTIAAPSGYTVPDFDYENMRLITLDAEGNPSRFITWDNVYYQITGLWGYAETPPQIVEATLQLATHFWRNRDKGLSGTIGDMQTEEQFPERDFPRSVRRILDEFYKSLGTKPKGGLILA